MIEQGMAEGRKTKQKKNITQQYNSSHLAEIKHVPRYSLDINGLSDEFYKGMNGTLTFQNGRRSTWSHIINKGLNWSQIFICSPPKPGQFQQFGQLPYGNSTVFRRVNLLDR